MWLAARTVVSHQPFPLLSHCNILVNLLARLDRDLLAVHSLHVQPSNILHSHLRVHGVRKHLDRDERIPEILVGNNEYKVMVREAAKLDVQRIAERT